MKIKTRAFTLIELLVVIAIIAILAAILFPVFAQAKEAAKKTSCLSNTKQLDLAVQMYQNDFDDMTCPSFCSDGGVFRDVEQTQYRSWNPWTNLVQPYAKNTSILLCPTNKSDTFILAHDPIGRSEIYAGYGYNYGYLGKYGAGTDSAGNSFWTPISATAVHRPANTVMFAESQGENYASADHNSVWVDPIGPIIDPPDACLSDQVFWNQGWGNQSDLTQYFDFPGLGGLSPHHGGGYVPNKMPDGGANTAFEDGHSKYFKVGGLAAGTNYDPTKPGCNVYVVDHSKYLWDSRF